MNKIAWENQFKKKKIYIKLHAFLFFDSYAHRFIYIIIWCLKLL